MTQVQEDDFSKELALAFEEGTETEAPETPEEETQAPEQPDQQQQEDEPEETQAPEVPEVPEETQAPEPTPLTEEGVLRLFNEAKQQEQTSAREVEMATEDILSSYYPEGLSEVLVDQNTGKELRTPQDVVDASNGEMGIEEATQWLMNKEYELKKNVAEIKENARQIAENTLTFKRDAVAAVQKYEPLFAAYPQLQEKVFDLMMAQVDYDKEKGAILKAPDVLDLYDTYLEPYQKAFEFGNSAQAQAQQQPAETQPPAPTQDDRLDEGAGGDSAGSPQDDPTDFAQQVNKELMGDI